LLPANLVCCELRGPAALPRFLSEADRPWIRRLVDACDHGEGRPIRELDDRLREPLPGVPDDKRRLVAHVLLGLARSRVGSPVPPREARARVFAAAARLPACSAEEVLAACAAELRVTPEALRDALFADIPGDRLALPPASLDPGELALRANLLLAQALLARAFRVRISLEGNARAVIRHASLRGLICSVMPGPAGEGARLEISGPFALFRRTLLYGRALGSLLPVLAWTKRFRLDADCEFRGRAATVTLATGDPIFPSAEPRRFDSKVEERFARDFGRAAPGWTIVREPEPIRAGAHLVFPDFAVHPRHDPCARWLVEIVGFWTAEYLVAKLERLREARIANLVLCIDEERNVGPGDLPASVRIVRYRRRVDPSAVLRAMAGD
jgi:predicted nuclease of restriction endonuclease-like RecB superfamily